MFSQAVHNTLLRRILKACNDADLRASITPVECRTCPEVGASRYFQITPIDLPNPKWFKISVKLSGRAGWLDGDEYFQKLAKAQVLLTPRPPPLIAEVLEWLKKHKKQKDEERKQELMKREIWQIDQAYKAWVKTAIFPKFLNLPGELRDKIYDLALASGKVHIYRYTDGPSITSPYGEYSSYGNISKATKGLLLVNRQVNYEASSILYTNRAFGSLTLATSFDRLPKRFMDPFQKIILSLNHWECLLAFKADLADITDERDDSLLNSIVRRPVERLVIELPHRWQLHKPMYGSERTPPYRIPCQTVMSKWIVRAVKTLCVRYGCAESVVFEGDDFTNEKGFTADEKVELAAVEREYGRWSYNELNGLIGQRYKEAPDYECALFCVRRVPRVPKYAPINGY